MIRILIAYANVSIFCSIFARAASEYIYL